LAAAYKMPPYSEYDRRKEGFRIPPMVPAQAARSVAGFKMPPYNTTITTTITTTTTTTSTVSLSESGF